jgi:hypothetical protein
VAGGYIDTPNENTNLLKWSIDNTLDDTSIGQSTISFALPYATLPTTSITDYDSTTDRVTTRDDSNVVVSRTIPRVAAGKSTSLIVTLPINTRSCSQYRSELMTWTMLGLMVCFLLCCSANLLCFFKGWCCFKREDPDYVPLTAAPQDKEV